MHWILLLRAHKNFTSLVLGPWLLVFFAVAPQSDLQFCDVYVWKSSNPVGPAA